MAKEIKKYGKTTLILGLILVLIATYFTTSTSLAATITNREMKISDSRPSATGVIYDFEGDHSGTSVQCLRVQYCTTSSGACTKPTGMVTTSATKGASGDWAGWVYANWTINNATDGETKYTFATGEAPSPTANASFSTGTITNSSTTNTTYYARVTTYTNTDCATGATDDGVTAFAIISEVTVSATVRESLTTSVNAVNSATCTTTGGTKITSTATTVPFGDVTAETFYDICQDFRVGTNAGAGYYTTLKKTQLLTSGANTIADGTCDGSCTSATAAGWATAGNNGFGYCMDDIATYGDGAQTADAAWGTNYCGAGTQYFKTIDGTTPRNIMSSAAAVSDDRAYVGYRLTVDAAQAAGTYSTVVIYVTTPTY